jgi:hypothetical protein
VNAADTAPGKLMNRQIGVDADVFDNQHTQAVQLQVARHSCLTIGWLMRTAAAVVVAMTVATQAKAGPTLGLLV